jgi:hypothetical protein
MSSKATKIIRQVNRGDLVIFDGNIIFKRSHLPSALVSGQYTSVNFENTEILRMDSNGLVVNGNVTSNSVITLSDRNAKENIEKNNRETVLEGVEKLSSYTYNLIGEKDRRMIGVIAQEVEEQFPNATFRQGEKIYVDYSSLTALLVDCVSELSQRVKTLEKKLEKFGDI